MWRRFARTEKGNEYDSRRHPGRFLKTTLTVSFHFHHIQMDGAHAGRFLELVQQSIRQLRASAAREVPGRPTTP